MIKYSDAELQQLNEVAAKDGHAASALFAADQFQNNVQILNDMLPTFRMTQNPAMRQQIMMSMSQVFADVGDCMLQILGLEEDVIRKISTALEDKIVNQTPALKGFMQEVYDITGDDRMPKAIAVTDKLSQELCCKILNVPSSSVFFATVPQNFPN